MTKKKRSAKKKVARKPRNPRAPKPKKVPKISTGDAKKKVATDSVNLTLLVCDALEKMGAVRAKLGMICDDKIIKKLKMEEGEHFRYFDGGCVFIPHLTHPVKLVELARDLRLLRIAADQEEGTYFPLQVPAWLHLYPELL